MSQQTTLKKLLLQGKNSGRWMAWLSLCVGTLLLFVALMIWWNFRLLLNGKNENESLNASFLMVGKAVTNENMAKPGATVFSASEIEALKNTPQVMDLGTVTSNRFPAYISLRSMGFTSDIFLESVSGRFIDKKKEMTAWDWKEGDSEVPVILSTEFLNLYNYGFALSHGLPQLSQSSVSAIPLELIIGNGEGRKILTARISGFSDRINSVLVPELFMQYANGHFGSGSDAPSRVILKVADPSDKSFVDFLEQHHYTTNAEQLRWSKLRSIVDVIVPAIGIIALLLMGVSVLVFILFIQLTVAKAKDSLQLLLQIGYSPKYLRSYVTGRFLPFLLSALLVPVLGAVALQWFLSQAIAELDLALPVFPGLPVWIALGFCVAMIMVLVKGSVAKALRGV